MQLQTKIPLQQEQHKNQINYNSNLLLIGSCFSENIGEKLNYFKFNTEINPFGILFHPKAIEQFISDCINLKEYTTNDIFYHNERWHSFNAHSNISNSDKKVLLNHLNIAIQETHKRLKNTSHVIITLGTSWVYRFLETNTLVANCHKISQKNFNKEILTIEQISLSLNKIIELITSLNQNTTIIFTLSPVRHIKDGFIENQRSKSHLISAIHKAITHPKAYYFPSYEIMMDELRDYRFYKEDMIHPNATAINYIWERFSEVWLDESEKNIRKQINTIQKGLAHRPFNENSESHQLFLKSLEQKKETLKKAFPSITFEL